MSRTRDLAKARAKGQELTSRYYYLDLNAEEIAQAYKYMKEVEEKEGNGWGLFSLIAFMFDAGLWYGVQHERTQQKKKLKQEAARGLDHGKAAN